MKKIAEKIKNFKIYSDERFPLVKNGLFVFIFTVSSFCFSRITNKDVQTFSPDEIFGSVFRSGFGTLAMTFSVMFLFFLQLRILDEFKDYEEDLKYRSYRPVQRGIVSLGELKMLGIATAIIQIALTLLIDTRLMVYVFIVWAYMFLMTKEFFIKEWLTRRIVIYALSHVVIMLLFVLFIFKAETYSFLVRRGGHSKAVLILFFVSYINGIVLELGRKIRKSDEEEKGVQTYSKLLGREKAALILIIIFFAEYFLVILGILGISYIADIKYVIIFITLVLIGSIYFLIKFLEEDLSGKVVETVSGLWIISTYLSLGLLHCFF